MNKKMYIMPLTSAETYEAKMVICVGSRESVNLPGNPSTPAPGGGGLTTPARKLYV